MGLARVATFAVALTAGLNSPPSLLDEPAVLLVRADGVNAALRSFLPLGISAQTPDGSAWTLKDVVACGAEPSGGERVLVAGGSDEIRGKQRLGSSDCHLSLMDLAKRNCGSKASFIAEGAVVWDGMAAKLRLSRGISNRASISGACVAHAFNSGGSEVASLTKQTVVSSFAISQLIDAQVQTKGDVAAVFVRPNGMTSSTEAEMNSTIDSMRGDSSDPLENAVLEIGISDLSHALQTAVANRPMSFDLGNAGPALPKRGTIRSLSVNSGPAGSLILTGPLETDNSGTYATSIILQGTDLSVSSITSQYLREDCSGIANINQRLECEGRNQLRPVLAQQIAQLLTRILKGVSIRPVSSLFYLKVPFSSAGTQVIPLIRRVERVGDRIRVHAFIASQVASS